MKGAPAVLAVLFTLSSTAVHAQTPPPLLVQADISGSLGWLNVNKTELESYNDWYNRSLQGAATFGWYWTNHLKTEVEVSASTRGELYAGGQRYVGGTFVDSFVEHRFSTRRVTLGQLYQFGRNAWFHPHAGAGIDVNRERQSRDRRATTIYDPATRQTRVVQDRAFDATTDVHVRPFGTLGFKAYMTPRAFFRSDLRIVGARRLDEVVLRFGLGVDF